MRQMNTKADLHFHTWYSIDSFIPPKTAVEMAIKRGIGVLAITDHDTIQGALAVQKYVAEHAIPLEVIIGEEIYTNGGHVVGLFLRKKVDSFQSLEKTLRDIKKQGGIAVIPHMMFDEDPLGEYLYRYQVSIFDLMHRPQLLEHIDGVEIENFSLIEPDFGKKMRFLNTNLLRKAEIGASDCHIVRNFGHAHTVFEGETAEDLRRAILEKKTRAVMTGQQRIIHQIMGWGPVVKLPVHLVLQRTYRVVMGIALIGKRLARAALGKGQKTKKTSIKHAENNR